MENTRKRLWPICARPSATATCTWPTDPGLGIELNCEVIEGLLAEGESYEEEWISLLQLYKKLSFYSRTRMAFLHPQ